MSHQPSTIITPKALLLDERLTPLERNAWLTFSALAGNDGTVVISYEELRKYLPSAPRSKRAASETVSRAVLCLRLSTWIAVVEYRRSPTTGFSMASRYIVRQQPLSFVDACMEDADYLSLLERALKHACATIREVANTILDEARHHPNMLDRLPAVMREQIKQMWGKDDDQDSDDPGRPSSGEDCQPLELESSPAEAADGIPNSGSVFTATVRTVEKEVLKEVHTYLPQSEVRKSEPGVPIRFWQLPKDQQRILAARLKGLLPEQRQAVLAEWDARCERGEVRNAIAYLYGLIKKAVDGVFKLWAASKPVSQRAQVPGQVVSTNLDNMPAAYRSSTNSQEVRPESREIALQHLGLIKSMLKRPTQPIGEIINRMSDNGMLPTVGSESMSAAAMHSPLGAT